MSPYSIHLTHLIVALLFALPRSLSAAIAPAEADVIVYGSTPGGFCAAIAAAREGATVILLEPTNHIGGVNTGGLSFSDSNQTVRSTVMGLFDEWHTRIERDYRSRGIRLPYKVSVKDQAKWSYEPHVAARVTKQMLDEAKVDGRCRGIVRACRAGGGAGGGARRYRPPGAHTNGPDMLEPPPIRRGADSFR